LQTKTLVCLLPRIVYTFFRAPTISGEVQESPSLTEDEKAELKRLREENRRLKMERDILKKATVFFAKENQ